MKYGGYRYGVKKLRFFFCNNYQIYTNKLNNSSFFWISLGGYRYAANCFNINADWLCTLSMGFLIFWVFGHNFLVTWPSHTVELKVMSTFFVPYQSYIWIFNFFSFVYNFFVKKGFSYFWEVGVWVVKSTTLGST